MLSPEVWNFQPPKHQSSVTLGSTETVAKVFSDIEKHNFNHSVTIVLPDTVLVSEDLNTALTTDSVYYKIEGLSVHRFLNKDFIEAFVKKGKLSALSVDTHIDTDDCAAVTPSGHLVLNLLRQTYQTLGLEGAQSAFSTERYVKPLNVKVI